MIKELAKILRVWNIETETFQGVKLSGCFAANFNDMRICVDHRRRSISLPERIVFPLNSSLTPNSYVVLLPCRIYHN